MRNSKTALRERLRLGAQCVREHPGSGQHLEQAAQIIGVFIVEDFPADFRKQYVEIIGTLTRNHTVSFPEGVSMMTPAEVVEVGGWVEQLYVDVCEPPDLKAIT